MSSDLIFFLAGVSQVVCGFVAAAIASSKRHSWWGFFVLGILLGLLGVLVAVIIPRSAPKVPPGLRQVHCPRCTALQNVARELSSYQCWQCHLQVSLDPPAPRHEPAPLDPSYKSLNNRWF
ncbi:hypothetical protein [Nocardia asteroides]|uniref:hypothetical protein n=1 Tax=Nocardia asteroides TaxID=1824 RepID=UPI001E2D2BA3|nr:hypothetical protein [Nocardia asteroides]UGT62397.1 hypothetical protein LTT61_03365 [Nocardia asteroides]